jgi:hypothetical protein
MRMMPGSTTNTNGRGNRLERVNLMLSQEENAWLNQLSDEIKQQTGANVSRSEIVRAGLAAIRDLHSIGAASRLGALTAAKNGSELRVVAVMAVRCGVLGG